MRTILWSALFMSLTFVVGLTCGASYQASEEGVGFIAVGPSPYPAPYAISRPSRCPPYNFCTGATIYWEGGERQRDL